jgi:hypothetical protein
MMFFFEKVERQAIVICPTRQELRSLLHSHYQTALPCDLKPGKIIRFQKDTILLVVGFGVSLKRKEMEQLLANGNFESRLPIEVYL